MRFRKRIKIVKGLHLNLSGSGMSVSVGGRGASMTIGKRGTYLNTGIPGTGLYNRTKIGSSSLSHNGSRSTNSNVSVPRGEATVSVKLDDKGTPQLTLTDDFGNEITNQTILNKIKRSDKYKQSVEELIETKKNEVNEESNKFIFISLHTPEVISESHIREELASLKPQVYSLNEFKYEPPQKESAKQELVLEAKQKINKLFFWKNKSLRALYVAENLEQRFKMRTEEWEKAKKLFIEKETATKIDKDKEFNDEYNEVKKDLEEILNGNTEYVETGIERIINEITLPVEFTVNYEYQPDLNQLKIDLHLPQPEDLPQDKANVLSSGKLSIKHKTQKEIKYEYSQCICGIAFYLCGTFFNISTNIKEIIISGCLERINKATGNLENQYIYSVGFARNKFTTLNFKNIDPLEGFSNFEKQLNVSNDYDFKTVTPF